MNGMGAPFNVRNTVAGQTVAAPDLMSSMLVVMVVLTRQIIISNTWT